MLNLLHDRPQEIVAVDVNPTQNHLLELKIAAMRALGYEPYLAFLGVRPARDRLKVYQGLRPELSQRGGRLLRCAPADRAARARFSRAASSAFSSTSREICAHSAAVLDQSAVPVSTTSRSSAALSMAGIRGPGALSARRCAAAPSWRCSRAIRASGVSCPPRCRCISRIFDLMHRYLCNHLARDSHLLQLVFFARYIYEPAMPIYLLPGSFERIREALKTTQVTIVTAPAAAALADVADATFDGYSIADVSSYLSETDFGTLMDEIMRTARADARLCSRGIFVHRPLPARACSSRAARSQPRTTALLRRSRDGARIPGGYAADKIALINRSGGEIDRGGQMG